jgi:hypothetical protein
MAIEETEAPTSLSDGAQPSRVSRLDALIDAWFVDCFHGAPAMRDTDAFNHARAAKEDLKRRLAGES